MDCLPGPDEQVETQTWTVRRANARVRRSVENGQASIEIHALSTTRNDHMSGALGRLSPATAAALARAIQAAAEWPIGFPVSNKDSDEDTFYNPAREALDSDEGFVNPHRADCPAADWTVNLDCTCGLGAHRPDCARALFPNSDQAHCTCGAV